HGSRGIHESEIDLVVGIHPEFIQRFTDRILKAPEARIEFTFEVYFYINVIIERFEQVTCRGFDRVPLLFGQVDAEETISRDQIDEHDQRDSVGKLQQIPYFLVAPVYHDRALNTTLVVASMTNPTLKK